MIAVKIFFKKSNSARNENKKLHIAIPIFLMNIFLYYIQDNLLFSPLIDCIVKINLITINFFFNFTITKFLFYYYCYDNIL